MAVAGKLITRNYSNFRGVDFSDRKDEVNLYRSPDALNMWKNYKNTNGKCIETRPDIELVKEFTNHIYGHCFFKYNNVEHKIVHSGTAIYDDNNVIFNSMAENKSYFFIFNNILYILDGNKYYQYDGTTFKEVVGYIPTSSISRNPAGGGKQYEDTNMLTLFKKNTFVADGISTDYTTDTGKIDFDSYTPKVYVNDEEVATENLSFSSDNYSLTVHFVTPPPAPDTAGRDNVTVLFKIQENNERIKIEKCTLVQVFDNRVFFAGNPDYPNKLWCCSLNDPSYISDLDYYTDGTEDSKINALVSGNNALWVMKEPSQSNTSIFYHNPTIDDEVGKIYPSTHSSISTGCVSTGINFNDDIVFLSDRGLEGISGNVTTEQSLKHRSSLIDNKLLNEANYKDIVLVEFEGYLLLITGNHVYLADSRAMFNAGNHTEYEWFYWTLDINVTGAYVHDEVLFLVSDNKLYSLTKKDTEILSYWTTIDDEFNYPQYQKTTNKKGCVIDMEGSEVSVAVSTDNNSFETVNKYINTKGYVSAKIKKKKWKSIQLKMFSYKPFKLFSNTLESYIGSYVKR